MPWTVRLGGGPRRVSYHVQNSIRDRNETIERFRKKTIYLEMYVCIFSHLVSFF